MLLPITGVVCEGCNTMEVDDYLSTYWSRNLLSGLLLQTDIIIIIILMFVSVINVLPLSV